MKLADLEKAYSVPCRHCAKPMPGWDLFCPFCEKDQSVGEAGDARGASEVAASTAMRSSAMPQQAAREAHPTLVPTHAANEEAPAEADGADPSAAARRIATPEVSKLRPPKGRSASDTGRLIVGSVALALLLLLATVPVTFDRGRPGDVDGVTGTNAPARTVPAGADSGATKRLAMAMEPLSDTRVRAPQEESGGRAAPSISGGEAREKVCTEALAALNLCVNR